MSVLTCGKVVGKPPRRHWDRRLEEDKSGGGKKMSKNVSNQPFFFCCCTFERRKVNQSQMAWKKWPVRPKKSDSSLYFITLCCIRLQKSNLYLPLFELFMTLSFIPCYAQSRRLLGTNIFPPCNEPWQIKSLDPDIFWVFQTAVLFDLHVEHKHTQTKKYARQTDCGDIL